MLTFICNSVQPADAINTFYKELHEPQRTAHKMFYNRNENHNLEQKYSASSELQNIAALNIP